MKVGGFNLGKKTIIIGGVVIAVLAVIGGISSINSNAEKQKRVEEAEQRIAEAEQQTQEVESYDYEAELQKSLVEKYGEPPEGFQWTITGELEALSSDDMSSEDVIHTYIRSISILDFATAQKYSKNSKVYDTYMSYYDEVSNAVTDYYNQFLRKQYTFALESIENLGIESTATTADGTMIVSVKLNVLDLTDKDFWRDDMQEIYRQMRIYGDTESDDTKKEQYLYDYVYSKYEDGTIGKREVVCDFKITKENGGGWLISDDGELNAYLCYDQGMDVAQYILSEYNDWLIDTTLAEQDAFLDAQAEALEKQE